MSRNVNESAELQYLLDRIAIEDCLHRYCHAVDRCDPDLLRTVYWPEATDDHIFWKGNAEAFVDFCIPVLRSRDQTLHAISNILIRIEGNEARVQSYYNAYERLVKKDGSRNDVTMFGRYLDRMEKRDGDWRIAERKVVMDWWRVLEGLCGLAAWPVRHKVRGRQARRGGSVRGVVWRSAAEAVICVRTF